MEPTNHQSTNTSDSDKPLSMPQGASFEPQRVATPGPVQISPDIKPAVDPVAAAMHSGSAAAPPEQASTTPPQPLTPSWGPSSSMPVAPEESLTGTPVVVGSVGGSAVRRSRGSKKIWLAAGVALIALLIGGGAVFAWYLPNTPSHVWNTGINRSGKALNSLVQSATTADKLETYKTSAITGTLDAELAGASYKGSFNTTFDKTSLNGGLDVTLKGDSGSKTLSAKVLSQIPAGSVYPNIYFQLSGFKDLGLDEFVPGISSYDGKWIEVSGDYLQSINDLYLSGGSHTSTQLSAQDIAGLARATMGVTQQYVFSTTPDKAVFVRQSYVGKETVDGVLAYHYKVGVNTPHLRAYCSALADAFFATDAYKHLSGDTASEIASARDSAKHNCQTDDSLKSTNTFDMWIDGHYKLIHKIRVSDKADPGSYTELGQTYQGGDKLSLFVNGHDASGKVDTKMTADVDLKTNSTKATFSVKSTDSGDPYSVTATLNAAVSNKPVEITVPTGAIPIQQVLNTFGLGGSVDSSTTLLGGEQAKAKDSEREADINSLDAHIEAYFASNGFYPTLAQMNDASWLATNMKGLDPEALKDPDGTKSQLGSTPTATQYAYVPAGCSGADGCQSFTVSALLSDGTTYEKSSLN
ncbi:MAG TPA: hypothetical protein VLE99_01370 [Candidatus Saccharimonadales bacterium]|nr:hypothetical protein [Candidatus Saccharimonadales bacterium]